ncbi:hypothetical protein D9M68_782230 [compost metagenome]
MRPGDMAATGTDDHRQLTFEVKLLGYLWANDGGTMADQGRGETREEGGVGRLLVGTFFGVVCVVQAHADNLPWALEWRQVADLELIDHTGLTQTTVSRLQRVGTRVQQILKRARVARFVHGESAQNTGILDTQPLVGSFHEMYETHVSTSIVFILWYGTLPYLLGEFDPK